MDLLEKIESRTANVCIFGLGYVGLPLAVAISKTENYRVMALDVKPSVLANVRAGTSHIESVDNGDLKSLQDSGVLRVFSLKEFDLPHQDCGEVDIFIVCVPTPQKKNQPNLEYIRRSAKSIRDYILRNNPAELMVLVESTTYPGSTKQEIQEYLEPYVNGKLYVAYSPERVNPASDFDFLNIAKVLGGVIPGESYKLAYQFYDSVFEIIIRVETLECAEAVKVIENTFRFIALTFANQLVMSPQAEGRDVWAILEKAKAEFDTLKPYLENMIEHISRVGVFKNLRDVGVCLEAVEFALQSASCRESGCPLPDYYSQGEPCSTRFGFSHIKINPDSANQCFRCLCTLLWCDILELLTVAKIDRRNVLGGIKTKPFGLDMCEPGAGVGGHCIPIDPIYIRHFAECREAPLPIINECIHFNSERLPRAQAEYIEKKAQLSVSGDDHCTYILLGVTYKENVPDMRETPSKRIGAQLKALMTSKDILYYFDPVFSESQARLKGSASLKLDGKNKAMVSGISRAVFRGLMDSKKPVCVVILRNHDVFYEDDVYGDINGKDNCTVVDFVNTYTKRGMQPPDRYFAWGKADE
ncbi:MAG: hypothetical protein GY835_26270 [bacterium]|nr:hypothetical protein [bacterium]